MCLCEMVSVVRKDVSSPEHEGLSLRNRRVRGGARLKSVGLSLQIKRKPEDRVAGWPQGGEEGLMSRDKVAGSWEAWRLSVST